MDELSILRYSLSDERAARLERVLAARTRQIAVLVVEFDKPHNLMAILRTCEGLGLQDVHVVPLPDRPKDPVTESITRGAHKWLTLHIHPTWKDAVAHLKQAGYRLYASWLDARAQALESLPLDGKIALVFGNELNGLKPGYVADCDAAFILPMVGFSQSYNVSVACAMALQRLFLEQERRGIARAGLSDAEQADLRLEWYREAVPHAEALVAEARRREAEGRPVFPAARTLRGR